MSSFAEKVFSVSGLTIFISVCGLVFASVAMSKVKAARNVDDNLYIDRLYRSTIQLLVISIIGVIAGGLFLFGKFECRVMDNTTKLGRLSPSILMFLICFYILAQTADMVNSFSKINEDYPNDLVKGSVIFLVALVSIGICFSLYFIFKAYPDTSLILSSPPSPSSLTKKLDFFSNEIMF